MKTSVELDYGSQDWTNVAHREALGTSFLRPPVVRIAIVCAVASVAVACDQAHNVAVIGDAGFPGYCWEGGLVHFPPDGVAYDEASTVCGGHPCLAFHFQGDPRCIEGTSSCGRTCPSSDGCASLTPSLAPNSLSRFFCTLSCEHGAACPAGFVCAPAMTRGLPQSPYCIPESLFRDAGGCFTNADCATVFDSRCDLTEQRCTTP